LSADFVLSQLDGGQVLGLHAADPSSEGTGTLFRLHQGALYDAQLRGCWWAGMSCLLFSAAPSAPVSEFEREKLMKMMIL
jgi:hypothetical protein